MCEAPLVKRLKASFTDNDLDFTGVENNLSSNILFEHR
jgi:hypothetical protein